MYSSLYIPLNCLSDFVYYEVCDVPYSVSREKSYEAMSINFPQSVICSFSRFFTALPVKR